MCCGGRIIRELVRAASEEFSQRTQQVSHVRMAIHAQTIQKCADSDSH